MMKTNDVSQYLLNKPKAIEDYPFGPDVKVFKVKGKMFATLGRHHDEMIMNVKCDPTEALMLRDIFEGVIPGYHMNKKHWNTIKLNSDVPAKEVERMIDHSYALVVQSLKKSDRSQLELHFTEEQLYGVKKSKGDEDSVSKK